jgi:hypothetical protein
MEFRCHWCGKPAISAQSGSPFCAHCHEREQESNRRWEEIAKAGGIWNPSRDDLWWRDWLTSRELFAVYHEVMPCVATPTHCLLGGTVFGYEEPGCRVEVWISESEVVVAYPVTGMYRDSELERAALIEFEGWIDHLRHSEPLELGSVRGRSSYGAAHSGLDDAAPTIKWAQAGDWAAMGRELNSRREQIQGVG